MYSAASMWPRSLSAAAQRVASNPSGSPFDFLFAFAIGVVSPLGRTPIRAGPKRPTIWQTDLGTGIALRPGPAQHR